MSELQQKTIVNNYILDTYLGTGQFGEVWKATDCNTQKTVAIKFYVSLDPNGRKEFFDEYQLASGLHQENLVAVSAIGEYQRRPYLVMSYCENGPTSNLVGSLRPQDEETIWRFVYDVAAGLNYLHQNGIVHQDIKPDNILQTSNGRFVISDFGISANVRATMRKQSGRSNNAGSVAYMSPEKFSSDAQIIKAGDIWALGVSIYELATGKLPFAGQGGVMQKNGAEMPEIVSKGYSEKLNELMQKCLALEPWDRIRADEISRLSKSNASKSLRQSRKAWIVILVLLILCVIGCLYHKQKTDKEIQKLRQENDSLLAAINTKHIKDSVDSIKLSTFLRQLEEGIRKQDSINQVRKDSIDKVNEILERFVYVESGTLLKYEVDMQTRYWSDSNGSYSQGIPIYKDVSLDGFYIGKYEITQKEFFEIMGYNPSAYKDGDNYPVHYCHFLDAVRYCNNRSKKDGFDGFYTIEGDNVTINLSGNGYRLPTKEEWSFAVCGEKQSTKYAAGDNLKPICWYGSNSGGRPHEVGLKEPNFRGIYDMNGNVSEIVWYQFRKKKGFVDMGRDCQSSFGFKYDAAWGACEDKQLIFNGFRVVLILKNQNNNNCSNRTTMYNVSKFY